MKLLLFIVFVFFITSCASEKKSKFNPNSTCSNESIKYLLNPRNVTKRSLDNPSLAQKIASTQRSMQLCYEDYKNRTGHDGEFNTCLVVGIDEYGAMEFYNFSSKEAKLDQQFLNCANAVTAGVDFPSYGWNYILVQSYKFYYE